MPTKQGRENGWICWKGNLESSFSKNGSVGLAGWLTAHIAPLRCLRNFFCEAFQLLLLLPYKLRESNENSTQCVPD
eukprot:scaffold14698_cov196-Amphora_coffeaeformis.AAC.5